jgi:hypothetical protein
VGAVIVGGAMLDEVNRPVAAIGVEDFLRAACQIDRRDVTLVVALIARIPAVGDI